MAEILATKYRPKSLDDVVGHSVVTTSLKNAFKENNMHQAYIFSGLMGTGKTSLGRILAAMENCEKGRTLTPCGVCKNCREIFAGRSLEVKEINAASSRGIDNIRELAQEVKSSPLYVNKKFIILDECHSLTNEASEAALKLIEEPPPHLRIILCTTSPESILDTIKSRCISYHLGKISKNDMLEYLPNLLKKEGYDNFDENVIKLCIQHSEGSMRYVLQKIQSVIDYCGKNDITFDNAQEVLGTLDSKEIFGFFENIFKIEFYNSIECINNMFASGKDVKSVLNSISKHLRSLLLMITCKNHLKTLGMTDYMVKRFENHISIMISGNGEVKINEKHKINYVIKMMDLLQDVYKGVDLGIDPIMLLEKFSTEAVILRKTI